MESIKNCLKKIDHLRSSIKLKCFSLQNKEISNIIKSVVTQHLSYLSIDALCDLTQAIILNERKHIKGIIIEAGCALGGSAIVIASAKKKSREFFVYDVFDMIPPPSNEDGQDAHERYEIIKSGKSHGIGGKPYYGYKKNLYDKVLQLFADFGFETKENNIYLIKGLYKDTLKINSPVALAHIDCDWYDSVLMCLNRIEPHIVSGGILLIDDYYTWSGCKMAVDEYFANKRKDDYYFIKKSHLHIVKK